MFRLPPKLRWYPRDRTLFPLPRAQESRKLLHLESKQHRAVSLCGILLNDQAPVDDPAESMQCDSCLSIKKRTRQ